MNGCESFRKILERCVSGESTPSDLGALRGHAGGCPECRAVLEIHEELSNAMNDIPEPSDSEFRAMRGAVLAQIRAEAVRSAAERAGRSRGFWASLMPRPVARPAFALAMTIVLLAAGFALGRVSAPAPASDQDLFVSQIAEQATRDTGLSGYWDSPFIFSNVDARKLDSEQLSLSFDVTRHVDLKTSQDSPLAREVLLHAILDSQSMGSRFEAMKLARGSMDPKLREVLIFTLLNDPSLPVRLGALDILKRHASEPDVRSALLTSLGQDPSVQVRFLALESLAEVQVDRETILRAAGDAEDEMSRAVIERAVQLTTQL